MDKVLEYKEINGVIVYNFNNTKRLNITLADTVKSELISKISGSDTKLIIDFSGISFIDSSGFGALVSIFNEANKKGAKFKICSISKEAMELIVITKLDKVFEIHDSLEACLNSF